MNLKSNLYEQKDRQWMKLQSNIGHFPAICGTCSNKNRYVLPNCPNER